MSTASQPIPHSRVIIIDFETSGLSPDKGARAIEVGAVAVENGRIVERFQSLLNPGIRISTFIEDYTGITNQMLAAAPKASQVIPQLAEFIGADPLLAHNASFDRRFLDAELARYGYARCQEMICSLLISRRIFPVLRQYSLEFLVRALNIPSGEHHRALADAEMTAHLYGKILEQLQDQYDLYHVPFEFLRQLSKVSKKKVADFISGYRQSPPVRK